MKSLCVITGLFVQGNVTLTQTVLYRIHVLGQLVCVCACACVCVRGSYTADGVCVFHLFTGLVTVLSEAERQNFMLVKLCSYSHTHSLNSPLHQIGRAHV